MIPLCSKCTETDGQTKQRTALAAPEFWAEIYANLGTNQVILKEGKFLQNIFPPLPTSSNEVKGETTPDYSM